MKNSVAQALVTFKSKIELWQYAMLTGSSDKLPDFTVVSADVVKETGDNIAEAYKVEKTADGKGKNISVSAASASSTALATESIFRDCWFDQKSGTSVFEYWRKPEGK